MVLFAAEQMLRKHGIPVSTEEGHLLFKKFDRQGRGRVPFDKFMAQLMPHDYITEGYQVASQQPSLEPTLLHIDVPPIATILLAERG